jgi:hypothetical protein
MSTEVLGALGQDSDQFKILIPTGSYARRFGMVLGSPTTSAAIELYTGTPPAGVPFIPVWNLGPAGTVTVQSVGATLVLATSAAPTYTNNTYAPLSADLNGNLRTLATVSLSSVGSTLGFATLNAPSYTDSTFAPFSLDTSGNLRVTPTTSAGTYASQAGSWTVGRTWTLASSGDSVLVHLDTSNVSLIGTPPFNLAEFGGSAVTLGQSLSATSIPVTVASDELVALGQAIMANSLPVAIASDQSLLGVYMGSPITAFSVQSTGSISYPWYVSSTTSAGVFAQQAGVWTTGRTWTTSSSGDSILTHLDNLNILGTWLGVKLTDGTNTPSILNSAPTTQYGLVVRPIPSGTQTVSGTVTANQGTANSANNAWPTKLTDGTNTVSILANAASDPSGSVKVPTLVAQTDNAFPFTTGWASTGLLVPLKVDAANGALIAELTAQNTTGNSNAGPTVLIAGGSTDGSNGTATITALETDEITNVAFSGSAKLRTRPYGLLPSGIQLSLGATSAGVAIDLNRVGALYVAPVTSSGVSASQAGSWTTGRTWTLTSTGATPDSVIAFAEQGPGLGSLSPGGSPVSGVRSWLVTGYQSNNNTAPGSDNLGVLPAVVGAQSYSAGNEVFLTTDTTGSVRSTSTTSAGVSATIVGQPVSVNVNNTPTITAITQSVGVSATVVGQPISTLTVDPANPTTQKQAITSQTSAGVSFPYARPDPTQNIQVRLFINNTTALQGLTTAKAGLRAYITSIMFSHSAGGTYNQQVVTLYDNVSSVIDVSLTSAGTVSQTFPDPLFNSAQNTSWQVGLNKAGPVMVNAQGFYAP